MSALAATARIPAQQRSRATAAGPPAASTRRRIRVLLADDHPLALLANRTVLEADGGFEIVGEAQTGSQVLPLVRQSRPDLVLLDLVMPGMDGIRVLQLLRERHPEVKTIVFSGCEEQAQIDLALRLGAIGYLVKAIAITDLASLVRETLSGRVFHTPATWAERAREEALREVGLSSKELTVLARLAEGLSNREIAAQLWLSVETVKSHLSSIYRKLGVDSRVAATRVAYEHNLLDPSAGSEASTGVGA